MKEGLGDPNDGMCGPIERAGAGPTQHRLGVLTGCVILGKFLRTSAWFGSAVGSIGLEQGLAVSCSLEHALGLPWSQGNSASEALEERANTWVP